MQCTPLVLLNCEETWYDRLKTFSFCLTMYKPAKMRFPVLCLQVAFWNSLDLCESFHLSITICSTQFCYLQSILWNQKTIISLTIICHFISIILANVSLEASTKTWKKNWFTKLTSSTSFHLLTNQMMKAHKNSTHVKSRSCILVISRQDVHIYTTFYFILHEFNNKSLIGISV